MVVVALAHHHRHHLISDLISDARGGICGHPLRKKPCLLIIVEATTLSFYIGSNHLETIVNCSTSQITLAHKHTHPY